jgi:hypothetical protein
MGEASRQCETAFSIYHLTFLICHRVTSGRKWLLRSNDKNDKWKMENER